MKRLLHEPLLHFLLLGAGLFLVYGRAGGPASGEGERIVITQGRVDQLATGFLRMHQRTPDAAELDGLIEEAIREEIYYREAKALGLDEDDTIIRRRLRQKLEFVSEDLAPLPEPDDAQLLAYMTAHPEKFRTDRRYSISHAYLDPARHGPRLGETARRLLAQLQRPGASLDPARHGDAFLLAHRFDDIEADELSRLFGADFEGRLREAPVGKWHGPVPSGYGMHLVLVRHRDGARAPSLAAVRDAVRAEWSHGQRTRANERFYADLRRRYEVTVEGSNKGGGASVLVAGLRD